MSDDSDLDRAADIAATGPTASASPRQDPRGWRSTTAAGREFEKVLAAVQRALQMASYLSVDQPGITRVAVVCRRGQLIASAALHSPSHARFVLDQLQPLGFVERRSTAAIQKLGCDLLLVHAAGAQDRGAQRVVRASHSQHWPPDEEGPVPASAPEQPRAPRRPARWRRRP